VFLERGSLPCCDSKHETFCPYRVAIPVILTPSMGLMTMIIIIIITIIAAIIIVVIIVVIFGQ